MSFRYIFIVGCDRTGTTLLVNILNKHKDICISNQTHFMGHLARPGFRQKIKDFGDLSDDDAVEKLVDFIYERPFAGGAYWRWLRKNIEPEVLQQRILDSNRTERALFSILMQMPTTNGETILGEKTPDHIKYVPELLKWFPRAQIIHTFRDPRAVFVSELKKRWNEPSPGFPYKQLKPIGPMYRLFVLFHMSLEWSLAANYHSKYKEQYPDNYYLLRFEDLISEPGHQIEELCNFLEIPFQAEMLQQKVVHTGFVADEGKSGFNKDAIDRWRDHLNPLFEFWFLLWHRKYLREFNYID